MFSGMRIGEITQLRLSDIDFTLNPVTITIRSETTKTRETRITHISSEAVSSLKDYLSRQKSSKQNEDYVFLLQHSDSSDPILKPSQNNKQMKNF